MGNLANNRVDLAPKFVAVGGSANQPAGVPTIEARGHCLTQFVIARSHVGTTDTIFFETGSTIAVNGP